MCLLVRTGLGSAAKLCSMCTGTRQVRGSDAGGSESGRASDRWWTVALFSTALLAVAVRVIGLDSKSVFADELASFQFAQMNWHDFWHIAFHSEANMSLYYTLLRFWIHLGHSVPFVRFFSVIPAVATVPLIYVLGKDLFSRMAGLLASLLFALNAFHISYSQAARGYSLAVFVVTLSCWLFTRSVGEPGIGNLSAYVLVSTAALYSHFFAAFVLLAQCVSLLVWRPARVAVLRQGILMFAVSVLAAPLLIFAMIHKTGPISWVEPTSGKDVYHFFTYLSGGGLKFGLSIIALALAVREYLRIRTRAAHDGTARHFTFVAMWLLVPVVTTLLISIWKPVFSPRFLMICLPAFALLVGKGVSVIRPACAEHVFAAVLILSCLTALPAYYRQPGIEDWKSAVAYLHGHVKPGDSILLNNPAFKDILEFSFREFQTEPPTPTVIAGPASENLLWQSEHTWVLLCHPNSAEEATVAALRTKFISRESAQFVGLKVIEFQSAKP
jgi:mannosyltransferase